MARVETYRNEGPPPAEQRMTREEIQAGSVFDACTDGSWMARLSSSSPT